MLRRRNSFSSTVLLLLIPFTTQAQEKPDATADAAEQRALELLDSIAERLVSLRAPHNRFQVAIAVADLLWPRDEKRARALIEMMTKEVAAAIDTNDFRDQDAYNTIDAIQQQRQQVLDCLARHDPELALSFLRATRIRRFPDSPGRGNWDGERNLELHLASLVATKNPEMALRIARASLPRGVAYNHVALLSQVQQRDPEAAQAFYRELVERISREDSARNEDTYSIGWNLLASFQPPQAKEQTYRELIEILTGRVVAINAGDAARKQLAQNLNSQMRWILAHIERHAPDCALALRRWSQTVERTLDPQTRMHNEVNAISQNGTVEDILALTQKYPAEMHLQIQQQAFWKALNGGDPVRARQVAGLVSDPLQSREMIAQIDNHLLWKDINENQFTEVRRRLNKVKNLEQKVQILAQIATSLASKGDKKGALDALNEARTLVASSPVSSNKWPAELHLIRTYSSLDSDQSVALLQPLLQQLNELVAAAVVLDGFEQRYLRDGEWLMQSQNNISGLVNNLVQIIGELATKDIDSATGLAEQLARPEIRLMAQLAIANTVLRDQRNDRRIINLRPVRVIH